MSSDESFADTDTRLAAMHGYAAHAVLRHQPANRADILRLEAKLDALIHALKAGAVGRWQ